MAIRAKWSSSVVESLSAEADALFEQFKAQLQPRVAAGLIDGLRADTAEFLGKRVEAGNALNSLKNATKEQNAAIAHALAVLRPARAAVHASDAEPQQKAWFGISKAINADKVSSVLEAIAGFLQGAAKYPDVARQAGLLSGDLDALRMLATSLASADQAQERQKSARKIPVENRKALQARIERAIAGISHAGQIAFANKPDIAAKFAGLIPSRSGSAKKKSATV